ncbi:hypothetical protein F5Y19DRAFT_479406 [Xylariaceae sp. FL1651]|nr:hypothetical protein F5Y19DRAFT_479406 [Xylariaceae sp. FL1651]
MAPIRVRQRMIGRGRKAHPRQQLKTRVGTRLSTSTRAASNTKSQTPTSPRRHHGRETITRSKSNVDKGSIRNRSTNRSALPPQRSSLRCALRESLDSLKKAATCGELSSEGLRAPYLSSAIVPDRAGIVQVAAQTPAQEPAGRTQVLKRRTKIRAATTRSSGLSCLPVLEQKSQRSSLRRAIRASLEVTAGGRLESVQRAYNSIPEQTSISAPVRIIKPRTGPRNSVNNKKIRKSKPSSRWAADTASLPKSQRSSLRRALRESLITAELSSANCDTAMDPSTGIAANVSSSPNVNLEDGIDGFPRSLADEYGCALSDSDSLLAVSSDTFSNPLREDDANTPSQSTRTSTTSRLTLHSTTTVTASSSPITSQSLNGPTLMGSHATEIPSSPWPSFSPSASISLSSPTSASDYKLNLGNEVARKQTSTLAPAIKIVHSPKTPQNSSNTSQLTSVRKGWHSVREIVNEVPSGLYLVEWEGLDPLTGVMWPGSWVRAKDVSASAIRDWEKRKRQMLIENEEKE